MGEVCTVSAHYMKCFNILKYRNLFTCAHLLIRQFTMPLDSILWQCKNSRDSILWQCKKPVAYHKILILHNLICNLAELPSTNLRVFSSINFNGTKPLLLILAHVLVGQSNLFVSSSHFKNIRQWVHKL